MLVLASLTGILGGLLAAVGVALAMGGDAVVGTGPPLIAAAVLGLIGLAGAIVCWQRLPIGPLLMIVAVVGDVVVYGPNASTWYSGLTSATAAGPSQEQQYWAAAPAMGALLGSAIFLAIGALLGLIGLLRGDHAGGYMSPA